MIQFRMRVGHTHNTHARPRHVIVDDRLFSPEEARAFAADLRKNPGDFSTDEADVVAREIDLRADYQIRAPSVRTEGKGSATEQSDIPRRILPYAD